ncbi:MAG: PilW family protein [Comamonas sp.]
MIPSQHQHPQRARLRGFTLVELMVGLAIGLVLVAGLALVFANASRSREELDKSIQQIENGRYAIELLEDDLSHAGFYGELPAASYVYSTPAACAIALNSLGWDKTDPAQPKVPVPIMGLTPTQAHALSCLPNHRSNTPAVVIHRLSTDAVAPAGIPAGNLAAYLQTSRCAADPSAERFKISIAAADFTLKTYKCDAVNAVRQYVSRIYYLADCNECGQDTTPTLKMAELRDTDADLTVVPLAEGIENLELQYGFDTAGTGNADKFLAALSGTAGAADNAWSNVVAVRLFLLSRTSSPSPGFDDGGKTYDIGRAAALGPFTDHYKRRVYTTTVRLTNVAGLREVPPPAATPTPPASP